MTYSSQSTSIDLHSQSSLRPCLLCPRNPTQSSVSSTPTSRHRLSKTRDGRGDECSGVRGDLDSGRSKVFMSKDLLVKTIFHTPSVSFSTLGVNNPTYVLRPYTPSHLGRFPSVPFSLWKTSEKVDFTSETVSPQREQNFRGRLYLRVTKNGRNHL